MVWYNSGDVGEIDFTQLLTTQNGFYLTQESISIRKKKRVIFL
jgi:hypothetical protein